MVTVLLAAIALATTINERRFRDATAWLETHPDVRQVIHGTQFDYDDWTSQTKILMHRAVGSRVVAGVVLRWPATAPDLKRLGSYKYLRFLGLISVGDVTTDLSPLASVPQLQVLNLSGYRITDLSKLSSMKQLSVLDLSQSTVDDWKLLAGISSLKVLLLDPHQISSVEYGQLVKRLPNCRIVRRRGIHRLEGGILRSSTTESNTIPHPWELEKHKNTRQSAGSRADLIPPGASSSRRRCDQV
jgi:hypothetical protein